MRSENQMRLESMMQDVVVAAPYGGVYLGGDIYVNDEIMAAHVVESGSGGIWTYKKWSDGTAECTAKIELSDIPVNAAFGNWYRSDVIYKATEWKYPFTFSEIPNVNMQFMTNNGTGGLVWSVAEGSKTVPSGFYLIRPTSATAASGYVYVNVKGKI